MISESAKRLEFKDKTLPSLEVLLQYSLWLTKNGREAARLMREVMAEAYWRWDESMSEASFKQWLYEILTKRFVDCFQQHLHPFAPIHGDNVDESLVKDNRLFPATTINELMRSWLNGEAGESDEEISFFEAIASLPAVCRSAMNLTYLEGFANSEIANPAVDEPEVRDSMFSPGRRFIREELFAHLMINDGFITVADREAASG